MPYESVRLKRYGAAAAALLFLTGACSDEPLAPAPSVRLVLNPESEVLAAGDVVLVEVVAEDEHGRPVPVGPVALTTDDASVALVDGSGRLRAVARGTTTLRGETGGAVGSARIEVLASPALFELQSFQSAPLPVLVAADSVEWDGEVEYHEVFAASGVLALSGGEEPRYELAMRYEEYEVRLVGGERRATLRLAWSERDRGMVAYEPSGDLAMTSELIAPLHHRSEPVRGGIAVDFRIPGSDDRLDLFYRR